MSVSVQTPMVSVVIPCFNARRYLGAAIDSVLLQQVPETEIIVVDDGCTDDSADIARSYGTSVRVLTQPQSGISRARNSGVAAARGRFLAFLDADDLWTAGSLPLRLERLLASDRDGIFGGVEHFLSPDLPPEQRDAYVVPRTMTARLAGTIVIRRNAFLRVGLFDEQLRIGEFIDWMARASDTGLVFDSIADVVLRRRIHGANTVLTTRAQQGDYLKVLRAAVSRRSAIPARPSFDVRL